MRSGRGEPFRLAGAAFLPPVKMLTIFCQRFFFCGSGAFVAAAAGRYSSRGPRRLGPRPERLPDDAPPDPTEAVRQAKLFSAPVLQHQYTVLNAEVVRALHENEIAVWAWSTTDESSILFSVDCGADALMGDDAKLLVEVLDRIRPR